MAVAARYRMTREEYTALFQLGNKEIPAGVVIEECLCNDDKCRGWVAIGPNGRLWPGGWTREQWISWHEQGSGPSASVTKYLSDIAANSPRLSHPEKVAGLVAKFSRADIGWLSARNKIRHANYEARTGKKIEHKVPIKGMPVVLCSIVGYFGEWAWHRFLGLTYEPNVSGHSDGGRDLSLKGVIGDVKTTKTRKLYLTGSEKTVKPGVDALLLSVIESYSEDSISIRVSGFLPTDIFLKTAKPFRFGPAENGYPENVGVSETELRSPREYADWCLSLGRKEAA